MNTDTIKLIKKSLYIFATLCVICFFVKKFIFGIATFMDYIDIVEQAITLTIPFVILYGTILWKYNPFEKTPRIMGEYTGKVEFYYQGKPGVKDTIVIISQNLFDVKVKIKTNEITSNTIAGEFIKENDDYVLYYSYITNPKSRFSNNNPIQRGTCRLVPLEISKSFGVKWVNKLEGVYWTSRQTIGDIQLAKIDKE